MPGQVSRGVSVSRDGRYIFFAAEHAGRFNIWRVDADGSNKKQLTDSGDDFYPDGSPNGQWVVFQRRIFEPRLWRVSVDGVVAEQLTTTRAHRPHFSPEGQMIAYYYLDPDVERSQWRIGVVPSRGGHHLLRFDLPPTVAPGERFIRWSPDGKSIAFINNRDGVSDIWLQPLNGRQPGQLTSFKAEQIIAFEWSRDGRYLGIVRGFETSDVVLIEQVRK